MHTVTARFTILPGKEQEAEAAIQRVVEGVSKNEPGALVYTWHRGLKDPSEVLVFEVYKDDDAVAAHRAAPYLADFGKLFTPDGVFDPASVKIDRFERVAEISR